MTNRQRGQLKREIREKMRPLFPVHRCAECCEAVVERAGNVCLSCAANDPPDEAA